MPALKFAGVFKIRRNINMCGIVGYIGTHEAAPVILEGLSKLEYRVMIQQEWLFLTERKYRFKSR